MNFRLPSLFAVVLGAFSAGVVGGGGLQAVAQSAPFVIDASRTSQEPGPSSYKVSDAQAPDGRVFGLNSRYLTLDGKPWLPVMGEFHFSRYPEARWEEEILKMKAAGVNTQFLPMDTALAGLREHRLNAFLTSGDGGAGRKLWDFLPYFAAINYAMPISIAFVRNEAFAALPEPMQREVLAAATETEQSQLALLAHRTTENYARMRDNGVHITEPAPASLIAALRTAATGTITAWEAQAGTDAAAIVEWAKQQ